MTKCIPYFPVYDIQTAVEFYKRNFGFSISYYNDGFAKLLRDEAELHLWAANDESWKTRSHTSFIPIISGAESYLPGTYSCRIEVQFINELFEEYKNSGVLYRPTTTIETQPWGTKEFPTLDLHGNLLTFFERIVPDLYQK